MRLDHQQPETTPELAFLLFPINRVNKHQPTVLKALSLDVGVLADLSINIVTAIVWERCGRQHLTERGCLYVARFCYVFQLELGGPAWAVGSYSMSQ